ncbi:MAG TPA: TRAP transporter TatT component family protein [Kofleriaceae bacterium]|jgi:hypothetical protein
MRAPVALLASLWLAAACGGASSYRLDHGIDRRPLSEDEHAREKKLVADGDAMWRKRADPAALARALALWQQAIALKDDDWQTYARLARGYFFQADAHVGLAAMGGDYPFAADDAVDRVAADRYRKLLRRGYQTALRGMAARSREFEQRLAGGIDLEDAVRVMRKDAASLVYWYVSNLASWARADGYGALFSMRTRILGCIHHLHRIDPDYFYRGADRLLGIYYAAAPAIVGGSLDRSRAHFETAARAAPQFLTTLLFTAEFLDRRSRDRLSFETHLNAVLAAAAPADPVTAADLGPENEVAKLKAKQLLGRIDRYFGRSR